ncbi:hypothetical protein J437_LFUL015176 [Ladona fulva]|uniref:Uncharacterized protein n=1 Tax=Ladona fulva TaxID=123851 RepID=A0A8K0KP09_LADFU|nr:hypothetical protein J437_LFUL015176 [Ladona fulva]
MRGRTPLHLLAYYAPPMPSVNGGVDDRSSNAAPAILNLFLECMPQYPIDKPDLDGNTALLLAYMKGNGSLCRALVKAGARLACMNKDGITVFNYQVATKQLLQRLLDLLSQEPPWEEGDICLECGAKFGLTIRKHHCRHCGRILCSRCSDRDVPILKFGLNKPVRVCGVCFDVLQLGVAGDMVMNGMNGMMEQAHAGNRPNAHQHHHHKQRNYKLVVDPFLVKGASKLYRYDGNVPNDPTMPTVQVRDPRSHLKGIWKRLEILDIPVPRFKIDANYVGEPPPLEVTICNLNDNIDKAFLTDMVQKFGAVEELFIYFHPVTNKHLGLARVVFDSVKAARTCVEKLNNTSVMGKVLRVFLDAFGEECRQLFAEQTREKKAEFDEESDKDDKKSKKSLPEREADERWKEKEELKKESELRADFVGPNHREGEIRLTRFDYSTPGSSVSEGYGTGPSETSYPGSERAFTYQANHSAHSTPVGYEFNHYPQSGAPSFAAPPPPNYSAPPTPAVPLPYSLPSHAPPLPHLMMHRAPMPPIHHPPPPQTHQWPSGWEIPAGAASQPQWIEARRCTSNSRHSAMNASLVPKPPTAWTSPSAVGDSSTSVLSSKDSSKHKSKVHRSRSPSPERRKVLDLDTRIEMLLKGKAAGGVAPPFLQLGISSESETEEGLEDDDDDFLSPSASHKNRRSGSLSRTSISSKGSRTDAPLPLSPKLTIPPPPPPDSKPLDLVFDSNDQWDLDEPLSTPPSPYISEEQYLMWHQIRSTRVCSTRNQENLRDRIERNFCGYGDGLQEGNAAFSDRCPAPSVADGHHPPSPSIHRQILDPYCSPVGSADSLGTAGNPSRRSTPLQDENDGKGSGNDVGSRQDDDYMSLSSLSSGDDYVIVEPPMGAGATSLPATVVSFPPPYGPHIPGYPHHLPHAGTYLPAGTSRPPLYPGHLYPPPDPATYAWRAPVPGYPHPPPPHPYPPVCIPVGCTVGMPYAGQYHPLGLVASSVPYVYAGFHPRLPQSASQPYEADDPQAPTISGVVDRVISELKQILKRDFNKKMIENTAFKSFETWWDEQERKAKSQGCNGADLSEMSFTSNASASASLGETSLPEKQLLLDTGRENLGLESVGFSLGLRAAIPKMPSFRVFMQSFVHLTLILQPSSK